MALSEDQKAMLRLLAQREQGYDDLAALMGLNVDEVRAKVKDALAQLEAEGEPVPAISEAEAEAEAPVVAEPEPAAPEPAPAEEPAPPPAPKQPPPAPKAPKSKPAPIVAAPSAGRSKPSLPKDRGVQAAIAAGLLVVVVVVVLLIVGGSGGGSGESGSPSSGSTAGGTNTAAAENSELTEAVLSPVDGSEAEGRALFGRVKKNVALQVEATGLEPSPAGSAYTIWLYKSPKLALRVGAVKVGKSGGLAVQLPIPTELLGYVANGAFNQIDISLTTNAAYAAEIARSKKEKQLPEHVGTSVLRGQIEGPIIH